MSASNQGRHKLRFRIADSASVKTVYGQEARTLTALVGAGPETLAEIKNPRPVYINPRQVNHTTGNQQVNNANGPQQVNNGGAPVRENKTKANKLLAVKA